MPAGLAAKSQRDTSVPSGVAATRRPQNAADFPWRAEDERLLVNVRSRQIKHRRMLALRAHHRSFGFLSLPAVACHSWTFVARFVATGIHSW